MAAWLTADQDTFYDQFISDVFSADGVLKGGEEQREEALAQCRQANKSAALACLSAFGSTDFREDLPRVTVHSLVIHRDADQTVPFVGSGRRTHDALPASRLHVIAGGPHRVTVSHADEFNVSLLAFLDEDLDAG